MPTTWYVNLPADPRRCAGPQIPVKVTRSVVTRYDVNRTVAWTCAGDGGNLNTVAADASWTQGSAPGTQASTVAENGHSRGFHNTLAVPVYGGDKYTITAQRSDKHGPSLTETVELRRKLYYVTNWMDDEGKRLLAIVEPEIVRIFGELGIDLVRVDRASIADRPFVTDATLRQLVHNRPALPQSKLGHLMRLAVVRLCCDDRDFETVLPLVDGFGAHGALDADKVELDAGVWQLTAHLPPELNLAVHRRIRFAPVPAIRVGVDGYYEYSHDVRSTWFDNMQDLPCDVVRVDDRTVRIRIRDGQRANNANLTRLAQLFDEARQNGDYSQDYFTGPSSRDQLGLSVKLTGMRPLGGQSVGPNIALTQDMSMYYPGAPRAQRGAALARVFAHEIAHSIGIVPQTIALNGANPPHGTYYTDDNGGQGPHCHTNAVLVNNNALAAGDFYYPDNHNCVQVYTPNGAICIMFHQRTGQLHQLEFCDNCKRAIRADDLSRDSLRQRKRWDQVY